MKQEKFIAAKRCLEADVLWDVTGRIENITTPIGDENSGTSGSKLDFVPIENITTPIGDENSSQLPQYQSSPIENITTPIGDENRL